MKEVSQAKTDQGSEKDDAGPFGNDNDFLIGSVRFIVFHLDLPVYRIRKLLAISELLKV